VNYKEIVLDQIAHKKTSVIPYTLDIEDNVKEGLDAHYGSKSWREKIEPFIVGVGAVDTDAKEPIDDIYARDYYGGTWRMDKRPWHLEKPPLQNPAWGDYKFPSAEPFFRPQWKEESKKKCELNKKSFLVGNLGWGLFERSWNLRGFDNALMDAACEPDFYGEMLDKLMNLYLEFVKYTVELPIDGILFGDDWGDQRGVIIGAERWRQLIKPRWAKIYEAVHASGKIVMSHSCGSVAEIIPDLIEIGLDVLESVQPEAANMDSFELKKKYGDRITFWGCLGSQSIIPYGTPQKIKEHVSRLKTEMGGTGGFILAPSKPLQPETPILNAVAILEAFTNKN
jgi:uroporphyrinogen decarboxylase